MSKQALLEGAENAFTIISSYNKAHPDEPPMRAFETFLEYAKQPTLKMEMEALIKKYDMEFYRISEKSWKKKYWSDWKLIIDGIEYPTVYDTREDWEKAMNINNINNQINESSLSYSEQLEKILDEMSKKDLQF